jgi:protein involved in ribonucleotide reduction
LKICYYSSKTSNTEEFVKSLGVENQKIVKGLVVCEPFVLIVPTYARADGTGAVHKTVIDFLRVHRDLIKGVIGGGNRNFGRHFAYSADVISTKCEVPILHKFELRGTNTDRIMVKKMLGEMNARLS